MSNFSCFGPWILANSEVHEEADLLLNKKLAFLTCLIFACYFDFVLQKATISVLPSVLFLPSNLSTICTALEQGGHLHKTLLEARIF